MIKKKKVSLPVLALVLCLMLPAIFLAPEANYTRALNDIFTNKDGFVISQQEAWSDDFDHGNITESGWSAQGYGPVYPPWVIEYPANITDADNGTMRGYGPYWNQAWRTSNVAYGSWAFDVYCVPNSPANRSYIAFVSGEPVVDPPDFNPPFEYGIIACGDYSTHGNHTFVLYRRPEYPNTLTHIGEYDVDDASGWWHINITRDYNGTFNVYFNDTLGITVSNTLHIKSDLFSFYADDGYALDNIVVVPYPDHVPPVIGYPIRTPSLPNSTESVLVNVKVIDTSDVDTVILSYNDSTTWFNITMTGAEPNYEGTIPALPNGTEVQYRFYANDTIDNWKVSGTYNYVVIDPTTTTTTTTTPSP
ncbi:MAG: hypothetical protein ACW96N_03825, partial [Candidatus Thorarchaeota archaeon]